MKRLLLIGLLIATPAYSAVISVPDFSADSGVAHLNTFKDTVVDEINGSIAGGGSGGSTVNIQADSIAEIDMADDANPRIFTNEILGIGVDTSTTTQSAVVTSGYTCSTTSGTLTMPVAAGTAYINGYRVNKSGSTNVTINANDVNYVWLDNTGSFNVRTDTDQQANSALVCSATANATEVTSVTDLALRRINALVIPQHYRNGFSASRTSSTTITVQPGAIEINDTIVQSAVDVTFTVTGVGTDWSGGSVPGDTTDVYGFINIDADGAMKLDSVAPTHDNYDLTTTAGAKRYQQNTAGNNSRTLAWFYLNSASQLSSHGVSNIMDNGVTNSAMATTFGDVDITANPTVDDSPPLFSEGQIIMQTEFYSTPDTGKILVEGHAWGSTSGGGNDATIWINDGTGSDEALAVTVNDCSNSGQCDLYVRAVVDVPPGQVTFYLMGGTSTGTWYIGQNSSGTGLFGSAAHASLTVTQIE